MDTILKLKKKFGFIAFYLRNNIAAAFEYRVSFFTQVLGMFINDSLWVFFWVLYFEKFQVLNGWTIKDLMVMWGVITFGFGLAHGFFYNIGRLPELINTGQLDYYLALPKNPLLHICVSQIRPVNLGDCLFGPVLLIGFVHLNWQQWILFVIGGILSALIYLSFSIITGSLAFFLGRADALAASLQTSLIHFTTYPTGIFKGWTRVLLFTLIPAGFIAEVPVDLIREFSAEKVLELSMASAIFLGLAVWVFQVGLKRYESGNLMVMRS